jgi:hypothetical protein
MKGIKVPILSLSALPQPLSAFQLLHDHNFEVAHQYCPVPPSILASVPYDSLEILFERSDGTQSISSDITPGNTNVIAEADDREEDPKYSTQDSMHATHSSEDLIHTIYSDIPKEPQAIFGSTMTLAELYAANSETC